MFYKSVMKTFNGKLEVELTQETAVGLMCKAAGNAEIVDYNYEILESAVDSSLRTQSSEIYQKISNLFHDYYDLAVKLGHFKEGE